MANCDPDQLEFNIQLDISVLWFCQGHLTATENFYLHGGGSWREEETTGFWFISSLPYHYGNVTPCLLPPLRQSRAAHK